MRKLALILLIGLLSCQNETSNIVKVEQYNHEMLRDTLNVKVIREAKNATTTIVFRGQFADTAYLYSFGIDSGNKNEIEFRGHKSKLIDRKIFEVQNENVEILKYRYDEEDGIDEELDIYVTADGRILGFRELAWTGHEIFVDDNIREVLLKLTSDTTDFFKYNYRFKYQ